MKIYGIDVSHHQGAINWEKTAAELRRVNANNTPGFAILRVGYSSRSGKGGLVTDGQVLANIAGCEKHGVPMGIYFYCYDMSEAAARITAQQVVKMLAGHKYGYPIYYDVEYEDFNRNCGKAKNTAMIRAALEVLEAAGYYAAVYCSRDFFLNYTNLSALAGFDKWEAAYTATDTAAVENGLWQYGSRNQLGIAGFGSSLDCNVSYTDYPAIMQAKGLNGYAKPTTADGQQAPAKTAQEIATEVLNGAWGNGTDRKAKLEAAGYDYAAVQAAVNAAVASQTGAAQAPALKPAETIAREVIAGAWGNGANRRNRLMAAGYDYAEIQAAVNRLVK